MRTTRMLSAVGLWLGWSSLAHALLPAEDFATRARRADLIVVAEPTSMECRYALDQDWALETEVWLAPLATLKGSMPAELSLVLPGGTVGALGVTVEDVPELHLDQPVVLLLAQTPQGWVVVGAELGAIPVRVGDHGEGRPIEQLQRVLAQVLR